MPDAIHVGQPAHTARMSKCPTPGKVAYRRRIDALIALASTHRARSSEREETRAYRCPCGRWHLTSKPKRGSSAPSRAGA